MFHVFGPIDQFLLDLRERGFVARAQADSFPEFRGRVRALDGFCAEVEPARGGVGADGRVPGVGQRAGLPVAEAGDVVFTEKGEENVRDWGFWIFVGSRRQVGGGRGMIRRGEG